LKKELNYTQKQLFYSSIYIFRFLEKIFQITQKKTIFELFLADFQKILIKQHISRDFYC